jgi:uncharacterized membrane-anchored protein YitT (DUF2179 family)
MKWKIGRSERLTHVVLDYALIVFGASLNAAAIDLFLVPNHIVAGGVTGLSIILHLTVGTRVGMMILAFNVPILYLGWKHMGGFGFFLRTAVGAATLGLATDLLAPLMPVLTQDRLLTVFYGGIMCGTGLALVFRGRGTTGGADVLGRLAHRLWGFDIGRSMLAVNVLVYGLAAVVFGPEPAMLALLLSFVMTKTLDTVLHGLEATRSAFIVCQDPERVKDSIMANLHRGVTLLEGRGGYTGEQRTVLYVVVARSEAQRLKHRVLEVDPNAFVAIYSPQEVMGGFPQGPQS